MVFNQGLGGPKVNPKGVADGQLVNIPTLLYLFNKVRNLVIKASNWILVAGLTQEGQAGSRIYTANLTEQFPEKIFKEPKIKNPYRKPTQVDKRKYAKVNG